VPEARPEGSRKCREAELPETIRPYDSALEGRENVSAKLLAHLLRAGDVSVGVRRFRFTSPPATIFGPSRPTLRLRKKCHHFFYGIFPRSFLLLVELHRLIELGAIVLRGERHEFPFGLTHLQDRAHGERNRMWPRDRLPIPVSPVLQIEGEFSKGI
jgi:hypothetical protein